LLKINGKYETFVPDEKHQILYKELKSFRYKQLREYLFKYRLKIVPEQIIEYVKNHNFFTVLNYEALKRKENLDVVFNSILGSDYPEWMHESYNSGSPPGIVPLLRHLNDNQINTYNNIILNECGIESAIYHFDFNGNPLSTDYTKCIAFPVHGMVNPQIIKKLINYF